MKSFYFNKQSPGCFYSICTYRDLKRNEVRLLFELKSKNRRDIFDILEFNDNFKRGNRREVLFINGTKFKIVKHEITGQKICITLEEL